MQEVFTLPLLALIFETEIFPRLWSAQEFNYNRGRSTAFIWHLVLFLFTCTNDGPTGILSSSMGYLLIIKKWWNCNDLNTKSNHMHIILIRMYFGFHCTYLFILLWHHVDIRYIQTYTQYNNNMEWHLYGQVSIGLSMYDIYSSVIIIWCLLQLWCYVVHQRLVVLSREKILPSMLLACGPFLFSLLLSMCTLLQDTERMFHIIFPLTKFIH